jgi:four helix bundle protein
MQDYRQLKVWEKAHAFALAVHEATASFGRRAGVALVGQLRRAALSVPANIAEGATKGSDAEFRRFLRIAMASAAEADYHLLMARDTGCLDVVRYERLSASCLEIRRMLGGLIKRLNIDAPPRRGRAASSDSIRPPP